ncbi:hypothetical protein E2562_009273 [Oryza meyeriana var. granulata]|uniref:Uncharacterized protein n=1 Tax=Oryza meyeriana var. granulata TaxID=110450 RepID=A0A6G1EAT1_9ORYZ|nr:hypothetical protein E2562_009273 [Oryza meyeriana var. granulata]
MSSDPPLSFFYLLRRATRAPVNLIISGGLLVVTPTRLVHRRVTQLIRTTHPPPRHPAPSPSLGRGRRSPDTSASVSPGPLAVARPHPPLLRPDTSAGAAVHRLDPSSVTRRTALRRPDCSAVTPGLRGFFVVQICLLVVMAATASLTVQGRPVAVESVPVCCLFHPDCCQAAGADPDP